MTQRDIIYILNKLHHIEGAEMFKLSMNMEILTARKIDKIAYEYLYIKGIKEIVNKSLLNESEKKRGNYILDSYLGELIISADDKAKYEKLYTNLD